ncbi:MAG: SGNH/GDSL hydrolase family protein [Bacteroidales bacterium]|nr:SGNH/GDSL hydrolase family protein [Bacteroidales bacterium]
MKQAILALTTLMCALAAAASDFPEEKAPAMHEVEARQLRVINKGFDDTEGPYTRIPKYLKDSVRPTLYERAQCSAGIGVRFATNSKRIGVRYRLKWDTHMLHMADTGLKGTDLYIYDDTDSAWHYVNTNRPNADSLKVCQKIYVENMAPAMRECMIYFPLYDGVEELYVQVDSGAVITPGRPDVISPRGRIVAYGTSILQGGCASRTGMASTNIISRELNREVINIGISGEGKQDACMARAMASIPDVALYLLDPVPNCTEMQCDTLTYDFVKILRTARPDVPIVMVEGPIYPYCRYDESLGSYLPRKNEAYRRNYERLKAENPDNLYYVTSENLDGVEDDGTVDGIHLTDLGFRHYADKLTPILKEILK